MTTIIGVVSETVFGNALLKDITKLQQCEKDWWIRNGDGNIFLIEG